MQNDNKPVRSGDVINIEPIETPQLIKIEPTASFAVDLFQNIQVYPSILARCLVHFRPSGNWKKDDDEYCYSFDWLRTGDTGDWDDKKKIDDHYANLIGYHYEVGTDNVCDNFNGWKMYNGNSCEFRHMPELYKRYLKTTFPKAFFVTLKSRNPSTCSGSNLPKNIKKLIDRSQYYYSVSVLLLKALGTAKIKVKVEQLMPGDRAVQPKAIVFREHTRANGAFTVDPERIEPKTGWQEITIGAGRGAKNKLSAVKDLLPDLVKEHSRNLNPILDELSQKHNIQVCKLTLQNFLKTLGYSWKRARTSLMKFRNKIEFTTKQEQLYELLKIHKQGYIGLYFADESHFGLTPNIPYAWQHRDEPILLPASKSKRLTILV